MDTDWLIIQVPYSWGTSKMILDLLRNITTFLHKDVYEEVENLEKQRYLSDTYICDLRDDLSQGYKHLTPLEIVQYKGSIKELEAFLSSNYDQVTPFAYRGKLFHLNRSVSVYPQEMITPDSYEVEKARKDIKGATSWPEWYEKIGNYIAKKFIWTSDKETYDKIDAYEYPAEALVMRRVDCEGHAFTVSSIEPGIGVAYGYYYNGKEWIGHSFNVFVDKDELYVMETTGSKAQIYKYSEQDKYKIYYIFTKISTYVLDDSVKFGTHL